MLIYKFFKYILLLSIIFTFSACAHKSITKEELVKESYLENKPCYEIKDSSVCAISSRIVKINKDEIVTYKKDDKEYFKLKEGLNKITIETDFINIPYTYETSVEIEVLKNTIYTLKYKIDQKERQSLNIRYQIYQDDKIIEEIGPKFMSKKEESSTMQDVKDYSKMGLSGLLIILKAAASTAILF